MTAAPAPAKGPIKRSPELQPLAREHHRALIVALRARSVLAGRAFAGPVVEFDALVAEVREHFDTTLASHAAIEDRLLGPELCRAHGLDAAAAERMVDEHRRLVACLGRAEDVSADADGRRAALGEYSELLERHVRFEDREYFGLLERALPADVLAEIGAALASYESDKAGAATCAPAGLPR